MKITWIGQAGLLFDNGKVKIMVDPYLSNSVEKVNPKSYRRTPIDEGLFSMEPDVLLFTHDHLDHYDPESAEVFLAKGRRKKTVLCPTSVWSRVRKTGGEHNYVLFDCGTEWTEGDLRFSAVSAAHSDPHAIGVVLESEDGRRFYVTGDTLYHRAIFPELPADIDTVFLPVNGVGNNMNATDAVRFFKATGAKRAVPIHVGMFDEYTPEIFDSEDRLVLEVYREKEI